METEHTQTAAENAGGALFLVNAVDNPDAEIAESTFSPHWKWIEAPEDWTPEDGVDADIADIDMIIVFSTKYREREIRKLCESIRQDPKLADTPLLVAVNQYEMPLANRVKELPNAHFVFTPLKEEDLFDRLKRIREE